MENQLQSAGTCWLGRELANSNGWHLTLAHSVRDWLLKAAPHTAAESELSIFVESVQRRLVDGPGFVVVHGMPIEEWTERNAADALRRLAAAVGILLEQNDAGALVDTVRDEGVATARGAKTNRELIYHTDFAATVPDIFGLLCLRSASVGGLSLLVSGPTVFRELQATAPAAVERLLRPYYIDMSNDSASDMDEVGSEPVFREFDGGIHVRYNRARIHRGHRVAGVPLGAEDIAALDAIDSELNRPELQFRYLLRPADLLLANNAVVLHNRTAYEDEGTSVNKRTLLRVWIRRQLR